MANVILGLLLLAPHTIYDLNKQFERTISLFYRASLGSLRSALAGLLARGEVEYDEVVERGRAKKIYRATDAGKVAFFAWMTGPIEGSDLETAALSKLFFLGLLPESDRRHVLAGIVDRAQAELAFLEQYQVQLQQMPVPPQFADVFTYQKHTLAYGVGSTRFGLEFFARLLDDERSHEA